MAIVGANQEDAAGSDAGAAYVFVRSQGGADNWGEVKKLNASDAQADDFFGNSVSVSGDIAVVGGQGEDSGGSFAGAAYVFSRNLGGAENWGEVKKLVASDAAADDIFGITVAVDGDVAIVGADREDSGGTNTGAAYLFSRDEGGADNWGELIKLTASDAQDQDEFGNAVALNGDAAVVGASNVDNGGGFQAGAAYVFALRKEDGDPCSSGAECVSRFCVDGFCCDTACGGNDPNDCVACSLAADGPADGTCGSITDGTSCDDGLFCTGVDTCMAGVCNATGDPCAANVGDADTNCSESCDEASDSCTANDPDGSACDDSTFCNGTETCTAGTCGSSTGDPCLVNVGDADTDCSESCDEGADTCTANDPDASSCDDSAYCNGTETCTAGVCGSSTGDPCLINVGDADTDCSESCDEGADTCTATDPDGSSCLDDGSFCTGAETCQSGACVSAGDPCAANVGDADTDCSESCDEGADSCTAADPDASSCDDSMFCNGTETCTTGVCGSSSGDPCAAFLGDSDLDCSESCDEGTDTCTATDPDGSSCLDDGLHCTGPETCQAGTCQSAGDPCAALVGDADTDCSESCNEAADDCSANDPNGSSCDDGLFCTGSNTCTAGSCETGTDPCAANVGDDDANCAESCNESADACTANDPTGSTCNDGTFCNGTETCNAGTCGSSTGDPCVSNVGDGDADCSEACNEAGQDCSANDPNDSACEDDGAFCTGVETCQAGICTGSGDPCTPEDGDARLCRVLRRHRRHLHRERSRWLPVPRRRVPRRHVRARRRLGLRERRRVQHGFLRRRAVLYGSKLRRLRLRSRRHLPRDLLHHRRLRGWVRVQCGRSVRVAGCAGDHGRQRLRRQTRVQRRPHSLVDAGWSRSARAPPQSISQVTLARRREEKRWTGPHRRG